MRYNQPFGVVDLQAGYINGNPSTGVMGSIPPAASIEYPQREIVNLISNSGMTPDNADLRQIAQAIQTGRLTYASDSSGDVNAMVITLPVMLVRTVGMRLWVFNGSGPNTSTTPTLTVYGPSGLIATDTIKRRDGVALAIGDLPGSSVVCVVWDGTYWRMVGMVASELSAAIIQNYTPPLLSGAFSIDVAVSNTIYSIEDCVNGPKYLPGGSTFNTTNGVFTCLGTDAGVWNCVLRAGTGNAGDEVFAQITSGAATNLGAASVYTTNGGPLANAYGLVSLSAGDSVSFQARQINSPGAISRNITGTYALTRIGANRSWV